MFRPGKWLEQSHSWLEACTLSSLIPERRKFVPPADSCLNGFLTPLRFRKGKTAREPSQNSKPSNIVVSNTSLPNDHNVMGQPFSNPVKKVINSRMNF